MSFYVVVIFKMLFMFPSCSMSDTLESLCLYNYCNVITTLLMYYVDLGCSRDNKKQID